MNWIFYLARKKMTCHQNLGPDYNELFFKSYSIFYTYLSPLFYFLFFERKYLLYKTPVFPFLFDNIYLSATKRFHSPYEGYQCTLCGGLCNMYHIIKCTRRTLTLPYYADDTNFQWYIIYTVHSVFNKYFIIIIIIIIITRI